MSSSPSFADFSWKHFLDKSLAHKFSSLGLLLETWSKTKGASWLNLPPASRVRQTEGSRTQSREEGFAVVSCAGPLPTVTPTPAAGAPGPLPSPMSVPCLRPLVEWRLSVLVCPLSLESGGQEWSMAFNISTLGPGTKQKPLAPNYPFFCSLPPCCKMQIRRKFCFCKL